MAIAVVTIRVMPESPETDLEAVKQEVQEVIKEFTGRREETDQRVSIEEVAFGLRALKIIFTMDESLGSPDALEKKIIDIDGVQSFEVTDVRRAIG